MSDQYARRSILRYERVFGEGYVSSGGAALTEELMASLELPAQPRVLDIGGGLGGAAFLFEERCGASVIAIDLSELMVELARERAAARGAGCEFRVANVLEVEFDDGAFDLVWTRDTLLHIADKAMVFQRIAKWLAPGGQLFVTDYARGDGELSNSFARYVSESGYDLRELNDYTAVVRAAGFVEVQASEWTPRFVQALEHERAKLRSEREAFISAFSTEDFDYLVDRWQKKIGWCRGGDMTTIRLSATLP